MVKEADEKQRKKRRARVVDNTKALARPGRDKMVKGPPIFKEAGGENKAPL